MALVYFGPDRLGLWGQGLHTGVPPSPYCSLSICTRCAGAVKTALVTGPMIQMSCKF